MKCPLCGIKLTIKNKGNRPDMDGDYWCIYCQNLFDNKDHFEEANKKIKG